MQSMLGVAPYIRTIHMRQDCSQDRMLLSRRSKEAHIACGLVRNRRHWDETDALFHVVQQTCMRAVVRRRDSCEGIFYGGRLIDEETGEHSSRLRIE